MAKIGIFVGTVYGNALLVAEEAKMILEESGHKAVVFETPEIGEWKNYIPHYVLVVTSSTGQGDLPHNIVPLFQALKDGPHQPELRYGLIALGNSDFEHYCAGGKQFDDLLQEQGARRIGEMLLVDASETAEPETLSNPWVTHWSTLLK